MVSKVVFYNFWHNGDVHLSRGLVKKTIEILKNNNICHEFEYSHHGSSKVLLDIQNLKQINYYPEPLLSRIGSFPFLENNVLYINTWYRSGCYIDRFGMTFDCLYFIFKDTLAQNFSIDISKENPVSCYPSIDYSVYDIEKIRYDCIHSGYKHIVLICNNNVESSQSHNFSFDNIVCNLSSTYPNILFILTNPSGIVERINNAFFFEDLFPNLRGVCNLNEISFLANYCKVIIGRASGPFTFCMTTDKVSDISKTLISFSTIGGYVNSRFWIGNYMSDKMPYGSDFKEYPEFNEHKMLNIIYRSIEK